MNSDIRTKKTLAWIGFMINPFLSLIISLKFSKESWIKNIWWAFTAFYAFHFVISNESQDINAYVSRFLLYREYNSNIIDFFKMQYAEGSTTLDIIEPLTSYLIGKVTGNYRYLFLAYGVMFGYVYSRNIWYFISKATGRINIISIIIVSLILTTIGIWNINGFRFWFASNLFIYGTINFIFEKKNKGLIFYILSVFTHIGLSLPIIVIIVYKLIRIPSINVLFISFLLTIFFVELDVEIFRKLTIGFVPDFLMGKFESYTNEGYISSIQESMINRTLPYQIFSRIGRYIKLVFVLVIFLNRKSIKTQAVYSLYKFYLFFGIFANLITVMASGGRYSSIANFILYGVFLIFTMNNIKYKGYNIILILSPIILLYSIYSFQSFGIRTLSIHHLINNPIFSLFIY